MRPEACQALALLIKKYGKSIVRMPSSCLMYMAAKLAKYPDELALLSESLRRGIPEQILKHAGTDEYEAQLALLGDEFARARGIDPAVAAEIVTAWATALNRPVGYRPAAVPEKVYPDDPNPSKDLTAKFLMTLIVGAGGFMGTALGTLAMAGLEVYLVGVHKGLEDMPVMNPITGGRPPYAVILIRMGIAGSLCGVATMLAWMWGKGDARPWAGFATAFGTGLGMSALTLYFFKFGVLLRMGTVVLSVFGATFTAAARGGGR